MREACHQRAPAPNSVSHSNQYKTQDCAISQMDAVVQALLCS
jgi:hypothetical protein